MGRCAAEAKINPDWTGGCLSVEPEVLPANKFAWYVFQRCFTQFEFAGMEGVKVKIDYAPIVACIQEGGFRGLAFFDQLERIQILELSYLSTYAQAREIERERKKAEDDAKKNIGKT